MGVLLCISLCFSFVIVSNGLISFENGGYKGMQIKIADNVTPNNCKTILGNLEVSFGSYCAINWEAGDC